MTTSPLSRTQKVWFITGASRGFGLEIARAALARGDAVVATARDPRDIAQELGATELLITPELDVTREDQAAAAVQLALHHFGRIDVLVNNAGRGLLGAVEECSANDVHSVFEVNVEGLLNVTRAVLPAMRTQRSGRIINMSSLGGFSAWAGWGIYCATKFAVEGISEALRDEVAPLGIQVMVVEPGLFRTDFLDGTSLHSAAMVIEDYTATAGSRQWAENHNHAQAGNPVAAAYAIVEVSMGHSPPFRLQLGADSLARVEKKLADVSEELNAWRHVALTTDYTEAAVAK